MLALFDKVIREQLQITNKVQVLLAVSGGVDSMCLVDLFLRIGQPIALAHYNYGLRGAESDQDADLVRVFADDHGIKLHLRKVQMDKSKGGIQEQARNLRYAWFEELKNDFGYPYVATAHHLDDQIETFMINLIRGTGIDGISGIPSERNNRIRPLLRFNKEQIYSWAQEYKIAYREDRSNATDDYLRNRIRHHITPFLLNENPNFYTSFQRTLKKLHQSKLITSKTIESYKGLIIKDGNQDLIRLADLPLETFELILFNVLKPYGINWEQVETISSKKDKSGLKFNSNEYNILLDKGRLMIRKKKTPKEMDITIEQAPADLHITNKISLLIKSIPSFEPSSDRYKECIDADKIKWPLKLRQWRNGDSFTPIGMKGHHQKLQDYFTNNKLNKFEKKDILILEDQESIVWIVGHRLSDKVKVTDQTTSYLHCQYLTE